MLVLALLATMTAACEPVSQARPYYPGLARIGDSYQLFMPLCPTDGLLEVTVRDGQAAGKAPAWWRVTGVKDQAGLSEFLVLGDDGPFLETTGKAAARPPVPAEIVVELRQSDRGGASDVNTLYVKLAAVPSYPRGADIRTIRYTTGTISSDGDLATPEEMRQRSECAIGGPNPGAAPRLQPATSLRPGAYDRVKKATLNTDAVTWMNVYSAARPDEDIASHVCDNGPADGAIVAALGRGVSWQGKTDDGAWDWRRFIWNYVGAYGTISAADAIGQVDAKLGCGHYPRGDIEITRVGRVGLPPLPGVDRQLLFCERGEQQDEEVAFCTLLLARRDILSRVVVKAPTEDEALTSARALTGDAAEALART
ncbi:hypothetical protein Ait01nite_076290 [Actinoplanes italicus]|uniref:Uncharacterized protein n=1 Tax=Actinoplanes italicus TaxID=113567 RepID=A0A2T0JYW5_9ACTN|nr:hypothetical protein CLV67_123105 [Actinoplanes italicus]GIE34584.1 hypothetical protein Ait01nite_076290 [Actinoplanes italicus]